MAVVDEASDSIDLPSQNPPIVRRAFNRQLRQEVSLRLKGPRLGFCQPVKLSAPHRRRIDRPRRDLGPCRDSAPGPTSLVR